MLSSERVDFVGLSETYLNGPGAPECRKGNEDRMWKDMISDAVGTVLDESYKGKYKEGCANLMFDRVWKCASNYGWKDTRIVWVKVYGQNDQICTCTVHV